MVQPEREGPSGVVHPRRGGSMDGAQIHWPRLLRADDGGSSRRTRRQPGSDPPPVGSEKAGQPFPGLRAHDPRGGDYYGSSESDDGTSEPVRK